MASMAVGTAGLNGAAAAQDFVAPDSDGATANDDASAGVGALATATQYDPVAAPAAVEQDPLGNLLSAARDQMRADGLDTNPLARFRLMAAGDDSAFGQQLQAFLDKIDRFSGTIDAQEMEAITALLTTAKEEGGFSPASLARLMIQVEGSAAGLPPDYLEAADAAQRMAMRMENELEQITAELNEILQGPEGSSQQAMQLLDQLNAYADGVQLLQERLRANFELAMEDPGLALERLQAGMQQAGPAAA